jgi:hypothetical protein
MLCHDRLQGVVSIIDASIAKTLLLVTLILCDGYHIAHHPSHRGINLAYFSHLNHSFLHFTNMLNETDY